MRAGSAGDHGLESNKKAGPVSPARETCESAYKVRVLVQHSHTVVRVRTPVVPTLTHDRIPRFQTKQL